MSVAAPVALDPIASNIGHGQFGLRSGLRTFDTLVGQSRVQKHAFVEIRGAVLANVDSWSVHSGSVYKITTFEVFDGRRLDVVGVRLARETLTRVETLAGVIAGTYFVDPAPSTSTILYARLSDSSNPASSQIFLVFGFYFGSTRAIQPALGADKLTDGGLDIWTSATALTSWVEANSGATLPSVNQDSPIVSQGSYSARLQGTLIPGGFQSINNDAIAVPTVAGACYRIAGYYEEDTANTGGIVAGVGLQYNPGTSQNLTDDGRSLVIGTTQRLPLLSAKGEAKKFVFDIVAPGTTLFIRLYMLCPVGGGTGFGRVWFDQITHRRIYRWELHEGRVAYDALPEISEGRNGIFFARHFTGQGSVSLLNGNGYFEDLFGAYEISGADVSLRLGGRFPDGGNEITTDDQMVRQWTARKPAVSDREAHLDLDDAYSILTERLPNRFLDSTASGSDYWPNMAIIDKGRAVPIVFGAGVGMVRMPRIDLNATSYGIYLHNDPRYVVQTATVSISTGWVYTSEDAADKQLSTERRTIAAILVQSVADATLQSFNDLKPVRIVAGVNDALDFQEGGGALVALASAGLYYQEEVDSPVENAMNAAGGTYDMTYDSATHKFTVSRTDGGPGTFKILLSSGANRARSLWPTLGFTANADTGFATSHVADIAVFASADADHIFRVAVDGYKDDTSGTYTGSASAIIQQPGDVIYFLLRKVLGIPVDQINTASVAAVRSGPDPLRMYLGTVGDGDGSHEFGEIMEWIENSQGVQLLHREERWELRLRSNTQLADAVTLYDRDFLSFESWYDEEDLASSVRIEYDQDPATGEFKAYTVSDLDSFSAYDLGRLRLGRDKQIVFRIYASGPGSSFINTLYFNAMARRRHFKFQVKGSLFRKIAEDQVIIARSKFAGRTDAAPTCLARIISGRGNPKSYVSTIHAVEVLADGNGW